MYRNEATAALLFAILGIMSVSGCGKDAAGAYPILKFMTLPLMTLIFLMFPNSMFSGYANFAHVLAAGFLVVQGVLFFDFGIRCNDHWLEKSNEEFAVNPAGSGAKTWKALILIVAVIFLVAAIYGVVFLWKNFGTGLAHAIIVSSFLISLVCLVVSITEWCQNGNLLTSAMMMAYTMWMAFEAISRMPLEEGADSSDAPTLPVWPAVILALAMLGTTRSQQEEASDSTTGLQLSEMGASKEESSGEAREVHQSGGLAMDDTMIRDFATQCLSHFFTALYFTSVLSQERGKLSFASHTLALYGTILLYGWSLVAPMVLYNRDFS